MKSKHLKSISIVYDLLLLLAILNVMGFIAREHLISAGLLVFSLFSSQSIWVGLLLTFAMVVGYFGWESRDFIYRSYLTLGRDLG